METKFHYYVHKSPPIFPLLSQLNSVHTLSSCVSKVYSITVAYPGIFFTRGGSTNSVEDRGQRERRSGGGSPLVRDSKGSCNLVQEISFHIVKFS